MIRALKDLILRARCCIADEDVLFLMSVHQTSEQRLVRATRRAADLQRARLLLSEPVLARKAAGKVIYHNYGRARPALRAIEGGKR
jgi:hypothetical protein